MIARKFAELLLAALIGLAAAPADAAEKPKFLFIGDMPYYDKFMKDEMKLRQFPRLKDVIAPEIVKPKYGFSFLVHYGDFKGKGVPCSEEVFRDAYKKINGLLAGSGPVFYTPGDNDWTDCDTPNDLNPKRKMVKAYSELSRLDLLRQIFFIEKPIELPEKWQYQRQPGYPENARWRSDNVQFATLHIVGTNNGRIKIKLDDEAFARARVDARDQANLDWLEIVFAQARTENNTADAVIITIQADITKPEGKGACTDGNPGYCHAFDEFIAALISHAGSFKKPVLLVHGDERPYCLDKKFGGKSALNLWRLNAGGDYWYPLDATVVTFNVGDAADPFSANGLVDKTKEPEVGCAD